MRHAITYTQIKNNFVPNTKNEDKEQLYIVWNLFIHNCYMWSIWDEGEKSWETNWRIYIYSLYSNCLCLLGQLGENKNLFNFKSLALFWNQIKMHVALDLCKLGGRNRLEFFGWQKHKIGFSKCIINYYYCLDACMKFPEVVHIYDNYDQLKVVCVIIIHE